MSKLGQWILHQLERPIHIFVYCVVFACLSLILNGSLLNIWSLHRDEIKITEQIQLEKLKIKELEQKLKNAKDPTFIERQAVDKYDLANEHDLVFVFADQ